MPDRFISLEDLELIFRKITASYAERGVDHIDLTGKDFYLAIDTRAMFDVYETPREPLPVGSLIDDLAGLGKFIDEPDHMATVVDIERLGNVLRAVSEAL